MARWPEKKGGASVPEMFAEREEREEQDRGLRIGEDTTGHRR